MKKEQIKNSGILIFSNLLINLSNFLRQVIMAYFLGVSAHVDLLLLSMIVPTIIQAMIGGGAGEILVIKRNKPGFREGSFEAIFIVVCIVPVILLGAIYFLLLNQITPFFNIDPGETVLFRDLTIIFLVNMIPGTFTSILRPHFYSKGMYGFYARGTIFSQFAGLALILVLIKGCGIYSIAWSYLAANAMNAVWFSFRAGLPISDILRTEVWKHELSQLLLMLKRVFSLGLQTFINYFATFWERSLSVKYLSAGYLSSLNYSKTLSEIPNAVLLSSVLTTSYIEQVKLNKQDQEAFATYTAKTLKFIIKAGFLFQILMLAFAPLIIILVYRRGKFDNNAVVTALTIFNILTISFLPKLIMNFFSRTMYILGEYRKLLLGIILKFIVQMGIMLGLIGSFHHAIPTAIAVSFLFISVLLYFYVSRRLALPQLGKFIMGITGISVLSSILLWIHTITLPLYIELSNLKLFLFSVPFIFISGIIVLIFLKRNGVEIKYLKGLRWPLQKRQK
jgi:putative peptidoglycan lipid II flippase